MSSQTMAPQQPMTMLFISADFHQADFVENIIRSHHLENVSVYRSRRPTAIIDEARFDLVMYHLEDAEDLNQVQAIHNIAPTLPLFVIGDYPEDMLADEVLRVGAQDYIERERLNYRLLRHLFRHASSYRRVNRAVVERDQMTALVFDAAQVGTWIWEPENGQMQISKQLKVMLGFDETDQLDTWNSWFMNVHPHDRDKVEQNLKAYLPVTERQAQIHVSLQATQSVTYPGFEHRMYHKDGRVRWFRVGYRNLGGNRIGAAYVDITEMYETVQQLQQARDVAEQASEAKSHFLASMSHELRTPLTVIIGYIEMLAEDMDEAEESRFNDQLDSIQVASRHLLGLVNNILDLSRIEANKMELHYSTFSVQSMVDDVVATAKPLIKTNNNTLEVIQAAGARQVRIDLVKVRQILLNLLSNAAKFTKNGMIRLEATYEAGNLYFVVSDTGMGMSKSQLANLFSDFNQFTTQQKYDSTGLGLAISQRLAQMMNVSIEVESKPGKGTTFTVCIPQHQQAEVPATSGT